MNVKGFERYTRVEPRKHLAKGDGSQGQGERNQLERGGLGIFLRGVRGSDHTGEGT